MVHFFLAGSRTETIREKFRLSPGEMLCDFLAMRFWLLWTILGIAAGSVQAADREPSEFRMFTDKRNKQIEARILSISDDHREMELERRDGAVFKTAITILSIEDQIFLRDWLEKGNTPPAPKIGIFGNLAEGKPIDAAKAEGIADITSIHAFKSGWLLLRSNGELVSFAPEPSVVTEGVRHLCANTAWFILTRNDGTVWDSRRQHFPELLHHALQAVSGAAHTAVLLGDGTVKAWGRDYVKAEGQPLADPPGPLPPIVALASTQGGVAAVDTAGAVHCWNPGKPGIHSAMLGDGIVEIEGSIFYFLARTKSGEVFEWNVTDPANAKTPEIVASEGPFVHVRCNGATRAAQREDGAWIAWGYNGAGIVDHINRLGPVRDLAFFSEPNQQGHGYVIWIE